MLIVSVVWVVVIIMNMEELFRSASFFLQSRLQQQGWQAVSPFCSGKGNEKQIQMEHESKDLRFTKQLYTLS